MGIASKPSHRFNKAGRLVFREAGHKFYEAHGSQHARFLVALHGTPGLASVLPPLLGRRGVFLEVGWVEVRRWRVRCTPTPADLAVLLRRFHGVSVAGLPPSGFDYWSDFVQPRFRKAAELLGELDQAERLLEACDIWISGQASVLQHPDLTPANVLRARFSGLVAIDNELCCLGRTPLLDVCNALHALRPPARRHWFASYWPDGVPTSLQAALPALAAAWTARRVGSLVVAGRMALARRCLQKHLSGAWQLPFDPAWM